ncbi:hypothetical protein J3459_015233 [Metarhizium acridum]|nr:hypothetical protein J3459_015233 [Metarhizium acridum]
MPRCDKTSVMDFSWISRHASSVEAGRLGSSSGEAEDHALGSFHFIAASSEDLDPIAAGGILGGALCLAFGLSLTYRTAFSRMESTSQQKWTWRWLDMKFLCNTNYLLANQVGCRVAMNQPDI